MYIVSYIIYIYISLLPLRADFDMLHPRCDVCLINVDYWVECLLTHKSMVDPLPPFISPAHNIYSRPRTPPPNRTHKTYVVIYTPTFVCIAEQGKILSVNLFEIQS